MLPVLDSEVIRHRIARRVATDLESGSVVNLGIGIPTLVSDYIPTGVDVIFQTENGAIGAGPMPEKIDWRFIGAGGRCLTILPGGALVSSETSFGLIRGGHLDATVLGALQIDQDGNLANWMVPGKMVPGMGGAMDLVSGARRVIVATTHVTKKGEPKIIPSCTLPLTGARVVDTVVTEFALFRFLGGRLVLCEVAPEVTLEDVRSATPASFTVADDLAVMKGVETTDAHKDGEC